MLGGLKAIDSRIDGLAGSETNPDSTGAITNVQPLATFQGQLEPVPGHDFHDIDLKIFGGDVSPTRGASMQGFVKSRSRTALHS